MINAIFRFQTKNQIRIQKFVQFPIIIIEIKFTFASDCAAWIRRVIAERNNEQFEEISQATKH